DARRKPCEVADYAAAQSNHGIAALEPHRQELLTQAIEPGEALRRLTGRQHDRAGVPSGSTQPCLQWREVGAGDVLVGHDPAAAAAEGLPDQARGLIQQSRPDVHIIGAVPEGDADAAGHVAFSGTSSLRALDCHRLALPTRRLVSGSRSRLATGLAGERSLEQRV